MKKTANKTAYIDHWIYTFGDRFEAKGVHVTQLPSGKWQGEASLPLINQTVKAVASSGVDAMMKVSDQATVLVEGYLSKHPEVEFTPRSKFRNYLFFITPSGEVFVDLAPEYQKKRQAAILKRRSESAKALEKAVATITRLGGTDKNYFVQVVDKSHFDPKDTVKDIRRKIERKMLGELSDYYISWDVTSIMGNLVIAAGYLLED